MIMICDLQFNLARSMRISNCKNAKQLTIYEMNAWIPYVI